MGRTSQASERNRRWPYWACCLAFALAGGTANAWVLFQDVTAASGLDFRHTNGAKGERLFPETTGSGCALFDYDRDGWLDVLLVNGGDFQAEGLPNALFRNVGDGAFEDVTAQAGVGGAGFGGGVVVGDYDGDGWEDLYLCNFARNTLFRNNGDGTFTDVTEEAAVGDTRWSGSATFLDMDGDGDLDLYVANYMRYDVTMDDCYFQTWHVYCPPMEFPSERDTLYRNDGDGTFTDVTQAAGITGQGRGLGVIAGDYDDDGDADVFVANDFNANHLYRNRGDGTFDEVGLTAGIALNSDGIMGSGMGIDLADYDNDGKPDLLVTNFQDEANALYRSAGDGVFTDVTLESGTGLPSVKKLGWGCALVDLDNDGWRDLLVVNGHIYDNVEDVDPTARFKQPKLVFRNLRNGAFEDVSGSSGDPIARRAASRGAAFGDLDNDGDVDILVNNLRGKPTLMRNDGGNDNNWLRVVLSPPSKAVGARVWVETDDGLRQVHDVRSGGSYASHSDTRPLFGLGTVESARVGVTWPDGAASPAIESGSRRTVEFAYPGQ